ncbi:peptide deformylase [Rhizobium sp. RU20A]|uniref:peptide deformylase n=1 Tax=Rhizobium sp. RU20A TaxID=1907412 RepID=UPI0009568AF7|nr:peptide deformylase [Rhizobium sp. RU20A]SIQ12968.1 peptide deformylase [Rhizobium sp. RU20A]
MAIRAIIPWPHEALKTPCPEVTAFDAALADLIRDLIDTLADAQGLGITAPHIGETSRVTVIRLEDMAAPLVLVNPVVIAASAALATHPEGSLSLQGAIEDVTRPAEVTVAYRTPSGEPADIHATGFLAACLQHEIDQLDGIFWLDRLSRLKRERLLKRHMKVARGKG